MAQPAKSEIKSTEKSTTLKVDAPTATERGADAKAAGRQHEAHAKHAEQDASIDKTSANAVQKDSKAHGGSVSAPPLIQDGTLAPVAASQVSPGTLNAPAPDGTTADNGESAQDGAPHEGPATPGV